MVRGHELCQEQGDVFIKERFKRGRGGGTR